MAFTLIDTLRNFSLLKACYYWHYYYYYYAHIICYYYGTLYVEHIIFYAVRIGSKKVDDYFFPKLLVITFYPFMWFVFQHKPLE
jgi:hypothetical protein